VKTTAIVRRIPPQLELTTMLLSNDKVFACRREVMCLISFFHVFYPPLMVEDRQWVI
jgi:hypothetical protein